MHVPSDTKRHKEKKEKANKTIKKTHKNQIKQEKKQKKTEYYMRKKTEKEGIGASVCMSWTTFHKGSKSSPWALCS